LWLVGQASLFFTQVPAKKRRSGNKLVSSFPFPGILAKRAGRKMSQPFALSNTHQVQLQQVIKQQLIQTSSFDDDVLPVCWFFLATSGFFKTTPSCRLFL